MNQRTAWIVYSALRLVLFAAPFALLYAIGWPWWLAAVTAALVGVSLSVIFLQKPREVAAESIYEWRNRERTEDEIVEDEIIGDEVAEKGVAEDGVETGAAGAAANGSATGDGAGVADGTDPAHEPDPADRPDPEQHPDRPAG